MRAHRCPAALACVLALAAASGTIGRASPPDAPSVEAVEAAEDLIIRATVGRVVAPQVFTLDRAPAHGELYVIAPRARSMPARGTSVLVRGTLLSPDAAAIVVAPVWRALDAAVRESLRGAPILVAASLRAAAPSSQAPSEPPRPAAAVAEPPQADTRLHPAALAQLIDEVGGREVTLPAARVISVLNPRAFLVESISRLAPAIGHFDRVLVMIDRGALHVGPDALVGATVRLRGTARTLLGMQVTREVPWPPELTRDILRRYEIRAALLASSVRTPDGVDLTLPIELPAAEQ
jgi:hypothetical protein